MGGEQGFHGGEIVVRRDQHLVADGVGDARGVGHRGREGLGRARADAHERVIVGAVEAALELEHLVASAVGPSDSEREERGLGPRRREAHLLGARHRADDFLRQLDDRLVHQHVGRPAGEVTLHGRDHRWMRVAQHHRSRAQQVVDVPAALRVPEVGAAPFLHHELESLAAPVAPEDAARQHPMSAPDEILRVCGRHVVASQKDSPIIRRIVRSGRRRLAGASEHLQRAGQVRGVDHLAVEAEGVDTAGAVLLEGGDQ